MVDDNLIIYIFQRLLFFSIFFVFGFCFGEYVIEPILIALGLMQ